MILKVAMDREITYSRWLSGKFANLGNVSREPPWRVFYGHIYELFDCFQMVVKCNETIQSAFLLIYKKVAQSSILFDPQHCIFVG